MIRRRGQGIAVEDLLSLEERTRLAQFRYLYHLAARWDISEQELKRWLFIAALVRAGRIGDGLAPP